MRVIPVLDLMHGQVVRGVGGRRNEYRPVRSLHSATSDPLDVARGLRREFGVTELYIADLDAIQEHRPASHAIAGIAADRFQLMVDAGLRNTTDGQSALNTGATRVVAALETLPGPRQLAELVNHFGDETVIFSLDLKQGAPIGPSEAWERPDPEAIAEQAATCGVRSMILLDLAAVGEGQGVPTIDLCVRLRKRLPAVELITGGGVRNRDDLQSLADAGVDAVLIASALHDGRLQRKDLRGL